MFERLSSRIARGGLTSLVPWAARWIYWNGGLSRLHSSKFYAALKRRIVLVRRESPLLKPRITDSVTDWMPRHGQDGVKRLYEPTTVTLKQPHTLDAEMLKHYTQRASPLPGKYLAPVRRGRIAGESGLIILPDGSFAREAVYTNALLEQDPDFTRKTRRPLLHKKGSYFSLVHLWAARKVNYYHWIHDTLLRLYGVMELLPNDIRYIVPARLTQFHSESLDAFGIRREQLEFFDANEIWELETLYFTPNTTWSGRSHPSAVRWLRERILSGCNITPGKGHRRFFITRRGARDRRITNEAEVEAFLDGHHFETVACEDLSFREQVALFAQAEIVVAGHGAGLTNLLWAPADTRVLEIFEPGYSGNAFVYWTLCDALGLGYWSFVGESVARANSSPDIFIPMDKLEPYLNWILRDENESGTG